MPTKLSQIKSKNVDFPFSLVFVRKKTVFSKLFGMTGIFTLFTVHENM
jgi:hypothetical protein